MCRVYGGRRGGSDGASFNLSEPKEGSRGPSATALHQPRRQSFPSTRAAAAKHLAGGGVAGPSRCKAHKQSNTQKQHHAAEALSHIPGGGSSMGSPSSHRVRYASKNTTHQTQSKQKRGLRQGSRAWAPLWQGECVASDWGDNSLLLITIRLKVCDVSQSSYLAKKGGRGRSGCVTHGWVRSRHGPDGARVHTGYA